MTLDLSSLQKAVNSLERAINVASSCIQGEVDTDQEEVIRAGVIQNFEFTYEQCLKFIKRWLEINVSGTNPDSVSFKDLLRLAAESQLINDVDNWIEYREARNKTSHTYNDDKADEVFQISRTFAKDAKQLLSVLENKND